MTNTAVSVADAVTLCLESASVQPPVRRPLSESLGSVLANDLISQVSLPPWTSSSMDGFAVHGIDLDTLGSSPVVLRLAGSSMAGEAAPTTLERGTAWRVATGGRIPAGADTVIRQEDTTVDGNVLVIQSGRDIGRNIRPMAGDIAPGDQVLQAGTVLGSRQLALASAIGVTEVMAIRSPRVAVLVSGDEIATAGNSDGVLSGETIADVNGPTLAAMVSEAGAVVIPLGLVSDRIDEIESAIKSAGDFDLLITAGGISVGPHDFIPAVMQRQGVAVRFDRVLMRPGGPATLAVLPDGRPWLALPGNPISAMVTFTLLGRPMLRRMRGEVAGFEPRHRARLAHDIRRDPRLEHYLRVRTEADASSSMLMAHPIEGQESWRLTGALADALIRVLPGEGVIQAGEMIDLISW